MSDNIAIPSYVVVENRITGHDAIKLTSGLYSGIIYSYGKVSFEEGVDSLKIKFDYEVHENEIEYDEPEFKKYIGDLLQYFLREKLRKNDITYIGGIE